MSEGLPTPGSVTNKGTKHTAKSVSRLPQTGNKNRNGLAGIALTALAAMLALGKKRRKND